MNDQPLAQYLNPKTHQLITVTYAEYDNRDPLTNDYLADGGDEAAFKFVFDNINRFDITEELTNDLFDGDPDAYQAEHDQFDNAHDLFVALQKLAREKHQLIYPITKYEHSGVQYYLGADSGWDYSVCGYVLVDQSKNPAQDETETIKNYLQPILDDVTDYANGYVYDVNLFNLTANDEPNEDDDPEMYTAYGHNFDYADLDQILAGFDLTEKADWHPAKTIIRKSYQVAE